jgi:hypothetical protein
MGESPEYAADHVQTLPLTGREVQFQACQIVFQLFDISHANNGSHRHIAMAELGKRNLRR